MENGPSCEGDLIPTGDTSPTAVFQHRVRSPASTARTPETFGPPTRRQVLLAGLIGRELTEHVAGFEAYTPDGEPFLGPVVGVPGLWLACGFCGHGLAVAGGSGLALARWIATGDPGIDLKPVTIAT